jgi:hypothetical protein
MPVGAMREGRRQSAHTCAYGRWQAKNRGAGAPRRGEKKDRRPPKEGHASTKGLVLN